MAVTGDHAGRYPIALKPSLYEKYAVPFVLYGRNVLAGVGLPANAAGSHLDIGRTLIELTAPAGFAYHAMGSDLLDPSREFVGISRNLVIGANYIADMSRDAKPVPIDGARLAEDVPSPDACKNCTRHQRDRLVEDLERQPTEERVEARMAQRPLLPLTRTTRKGYCR